MNTSISFKTFDEIKVKYYKTDFIKNADMYLAHTHSKKEFETFYEHNNLVIDYFIHLSKEHQLNVVINNLIYALLGNDYDIELGEFVKLLFFDAIAYHDFGKVNENFQIEKMKNTNLFFKAANNGIGSQHSILSAYIFIVHHFKIASDYDFSVEQKRLVNGLIFLFAYPIIKHHAPILSHAKDDIKFGKEIDLEIQEKLMPYLELFHFSNYEKFVKRPAQENAEGKKFKDSRIEELSKIIKNREFPLFALLKLNYSLLTASDYLATHQYMNSPKDIKGLLVNELGTIKQKRLIEIKDYINGDRKDNYNKGVFDIPEDYQFENPRMVSYSNLRTLRCEMAIEVVHNIEKYADNNLFYIEAPTGGGKTNLSMLACVKLLLKNPELNKVFYVFPFTTLITQTHKSIIETLGLSENEVTQLHSKAGFKTTVEETEDGTYGDKKQNYIDNLFVNYPFCLMTHIKFFDVLKGNHKETNYLLHRLANSVVIIDELQSYNPSHWDKIIYFIMNYAKYFNMKFILMSATLPKLGELKVIKNFQPNFTYLLDNVKEKYFQNDNFSKRVSFCFDLLDKKIDLVELSKVVVEKSLDYAQNNKKHSNSVYTIIEFIFKKTASKFYDIVDKNEFDDIYVLSGTILEPRRREIINALKRDISRSKKILLITTQVVEAGVDIDMDLGFKDTSLIDSDEQLAGRINRNVNKGQCKLYLFNYDKQGVLYKNDKRYEMIKTGQIKRKDHIDILENKNFEKLYDLVLSDINKWNDNNCLINFSDYAKHFQNFNFFDINKEFRLIEQKNLSVFVPLNIPKKIQGQKENEQDEIIKKDELIFLKQGNITSFIDTDGIEKINGKEVFDLYISLIKNQKTKDFIDAKIDFKIMQGIMSKFVFSVFATKEMELNLLCFSDVPKNDYGFIYLSRYNEVYSYEQGVIDSKFTDSETQFL